jgi:hypothetical protein
LITRTSASFSAPASQIQFPDNLMTDETGRSVRKYSIVEMLELVFRISASFSVPTGPSLFAPKLQR